MIGSTFLLWLERRAGLGGRRKRILDIGAQQLADIAPDALAALVARLGGTPEESRAEIERLAERSVRRRGQKTTFLGEVLALCPAVDYVALDIAPAPGATVFDLNHDRLPPEMVGAFDLVLDFGTAEHVVDQLAVWRLAHEAMAVGGMLYDQLPSTGYVNHGYFCYHPNFHRDLAAANSWRVHDLFYNVGGGGPGADFGIELRSHEDLDATVEMPAGFDHRRPWLNINVLVEKTEAAPFRLPLELRTAHSKADAGAVARY